MRDNPYFTDPVDLEPSLEEIIQFERELNAAQATLDMLNCCQCCEVHMNKPKTIYDKLPLPGQPQRDRENKAPFVKPFICHCPCRHKARWLCRYISSECCESPA